MGQSNTILSLGHGGTWLLFGAHPDDAIIAAGGTLHMGHRNDNKTYIVTATCGGTAANSPDEIDDMIAKRKEEAKEADEILGVTDRIFLDYPSQSLPFAACGGQMLEDLYAKVHGTEPKKPMLHRLTETIRKYRPDLVLSHYPDNHVDHEALYDIVPKAVQQASESILGNLGEPWKVKGVFILI